MGIGKRGIGILCGVLLCLMLVVVLLGDKKAEGTEESKVPESFEKQLALENHTPMPDSTEDPLTEESEEVSEREEKTEPVPEVTSTPAPMITPSPIPVVVETEAIKEVLTPVPSSVPDPVLTQGPTSVPTPTPTLVPTPAPIVSPTPTPEAPEIKEEHVHEFEMSVWELPTCQKGGYYNNVCKSCGVVECITQEPIPHEVEDIVVQEGNCMEDRVIRHICKLCEQQVKSDTRYTVYDKHLWNKEWVNGIEVEYCEWCGVAK